MKKCEHQHAAKMISHYLAHRRETASITSKMVPEQAENFSPSTDHLVQGDSQPKFLEGTHDCRLQTNKCLEVNPYLQRRLPQVRLIYLLGLNRSSADTTVDATPAASCGKVLPRQRPVVLLLSWAKDGTDSPSSRSRTARKAPKHDQSSLASSSGKLGTLPKATGEKVSFKLDTRFAPLRRRVTLQECFGSSSSWTILRSYRLKIERFEGRGVRVASRFCLDRSPTSCSLLGGCLCDAQTVLPTNSDGFRQLPVSRPFLLAQIPLGLCDFSFSATQHRDDWRVEAPERQLILPSLKHRSLAAALAVAGESLHVHHHFASRVAGCLV